MARRRSLITFVAALALSACNAAFGLEPTSGPDSDSDGISDDHDNCPLASNADQHDQDDDTLGDACDPCEGPQAGIDNDHDGVDDGCDVCLTGANSDEDGDTFPDGCDVCPGVSDDQVDDDGDGVGNLCDLEPGVQNHRVFFDGFDPPQGEWRAWFATWHATAGVFRPDNATGNTGGAKGAWNPLATVTSNELWVDAVAILPASPIGGTYVGVNLLEREDGSLYDCWVQWDTGGWHPASDITQKIALVGPTVHIRYHAHGGNDECTFDGTQTPLSSDPLPPASYVPALAIAGNNEGFRWIDVVSR